METITALQQLPPFVLTLLRLAIWLILLMVIFVPIEQLFSVHPRSGVHNNLGRDVLYYFVSSMVPKTLLVLPMAVIAWLLHLFVPAGVHAAAAQLPWGARLAAAFIVGEIGFYWGHRWSHQVPLLWRFHAIHHSADEMSWLINTRAHPIDIVFVRLCGLTLMYALGLVQPIAGARLDVVPLIIMLWGTLWGFFIHANLRWRLGWLEAIISTPAFHHWHHTNDSHIDKNYASMLPCLDKLFGTWYLPADQWPSIYGCDTAMAASFVGQLLQPIIPSASGDLSQPLASLHQVEAGKPSCDVEQHLHAGQRLGPIQQDSCDAVASDGEFATLVCEDTAA